MEHAKLCNDYEKQNKILFTPQDETVLRKKQHNQKLLCSSMLQSTFGLPIFKFN